MPAIAVLVPSIRRGRRGLLSMRSARHASRGIESRTRARLQGARRPSASPSLAFSLSRSVVAAASRESARVEWSGVVDERKRAGVGCGNRGYVVPRGKPSMYLGMGRLASRVGGSTLSSERVVTLSDADAQRAHLESR